MSIPDATEPSPVAEVVAPDVVAAEAVTETVTEPVSYTHLTLPTSDLV